MATMPRSSYRTMIAVASDRPHTYSSPLLTVSQNCSAWAAVVKLRCSAKVANNTKNMMAPITKSMIQAPNRRPMTAVGSWTGWYVGYIRSSGEWAWRGSHVVELWCSISLRTIGCGAGASVKDPCGEPIDEPQHPPHELVVDARRFAEATTRDGG
ncbi:unannotated protein [freshwater metagenome]|uniref:Unannotated protein n=1 Tax=freshwater metagenome TaxID=449393 RepID=A0A6J6T7I9_9ZZZZ